MVLLHQHQDIVDIDLYLLDQFDLKDDIVIDVLFIPGVLPAIFVIQVDIPALIILQIPCGMRLHFFKLVKRGQDISQR